MLELLNRQQTRNALPVEHEELPRFDGQIQENPAKV
jgi:hypothetical protein